MTGSEDHIRTAAYYIWLDEGRPEGHAEAHWQRASALLGAGSPVPKRTRRTKSAAEASAAPARTTRKATRKTAKA
jgi:hypothetical protein